MKDFDVFEYSEREELGNWITHALGLIFAVYGLTHLMVTSPYKIESPQIMSCIAYGFSLIGLYLASTLYHFSKNESSKKLWKRIDHIFIYFLIAGTYTPFLVLVVGGDIGMNFIYFVWGVTAIGTVFKIFYAHKFDKLSLLAYLAMGWACVFIWNQLETGLSREGMNLLLTGGFFYTFGTIFYAIDRIPYNHAIWHVFVLLGSVCHFFAVRTLIFI